MPAPSVAIRLGFTGRDEVDRGFADIGAAGDAAAKRYATAFERAANDVDAAMRRQQGAAAKLATLFPATPMQQMVQASASTGYTGPSARESAAAMAAQLDAQDRLTQRTHAFRVALEPAYAAQDRFNAEIGEARALVSAGTITLDQYCGKLRQETALLNAANAAQARGGQSAGALRSAMSGLSFQAQDAFTQISMGANPLSVLAIQGGQAAGQMAGLTGKLGSFASFMIGPWGLAITGGVLALGALWDKLGDNAEASKVAEAALSDFQARQSDIGRFIDATTGRLKEQNTTLIRNAILLRQAKIDENNQAAKDARTKAFTAARGAMGDDTPIYTAGGVTQPRVDPAIQRIVRSAGSDVERLDAGLQALARQRPDLRATIRTVSDAAAQAVELARSNRVLSGEIDQLNGKTTAQARVTSGMVEQQVRLATATTDLERARAKLDIVRSRGDAAEKAGGTALQQYRRDLTAASEAVNRAETAERSATQGRREHARSMREGAKDARDYARAVAEIEQGIRAFNVPDADTAARGRAAALASAMRLPDQLSYFRAGGADFDAAFDRDRARDAQRTARDEVLAEEIARREEGIRDAADLYRDLFSGGIDSIWDRFRQRGFDVLADLLARWSMGGADGGGLVKSIGGLFGGGGKSNFTLDPRLLPGNATGTERWSGGMTWVGENGPEIVSLPEGARITPAAASRSMAALGGPGLTLHIDASIHAQGVDPAQMQLIEENQRKLQRDLPGIVLSTFHDARQRGAIR